MENGLGRNFTSAPPSQPHSASHSSQTPHETPHPLSSHQTADHTANKSANSNDAAPPFSTTPSPSPYRQSPPNSPQHNSPVQPNLRAAPAPLAAPASLPFSSRFAPVPTSSKSASPDYPAPALPPR